MEQKIKNLLTDKLNYFKAFSEIVKTKTEEAKLNKDISEEAQNKKIDSILYNVETSYLFNELLTMILLSKELGITLNPEVLEFLEASSQIIYRRKFALEAGDIVEATKGLLEESRQKLLESDMLKIINKNLEQ